MYRPIRGWKPSTPPITSSNYHDVKRAHRIVAIHFWAEWNGVDPPFDAVLRSLPEQIKTRVHFVSCDVDDSQNEKIWTDFAVANIPYLGLLIDGQPVRGIMGMRESKEFESELIAKLSLPIATATPERQITKCCTGAGLARVLKWIASGFRPREH